MKPYLLLLSLTALVALNLAVLAESTVTRVAYGETCNSTRRCAKKDNLSCKDGVCGCIKPDSMIFENRAELSAPVIAILGSGTCATKVGERCRFTIGDDEDEGKTMFDVFACVKNSKCDGDGFCVCNQGFYENVNGTCSRYQGYLQQCNDNFKCSAEFQCINDVCKCESSNSVYDFRMGQCVGLAGGPCFNNACVENAVCNNTRCECTEGYFKNIQKACSPQTVYGGRCSEDQHCGRDQKSFLGLKCVNGKCGCDRAVSVYAAVKPSEFHNVQSNNYHGFAREAEIYTCAPKPNQKCGSRYCAPNSYCVYDQYYLHRSDISVKEYQGTCKCIPGTQYSASRSLCLKPYIEICSGADQCADGLACSFHVSYSDMRCVCKFSNQEYNSTKGKCESPVGGPCQTVEDCAAFAECKLNPGRSTGHCACSSGFINEGNNKCKQTFNTTCTRTQECDSTAGLSCVEKRCSCPGFSTYSQRMQKCVGLAGAACNVKIIDECTSDAVCKPSRHASTIGFCTCRKGFIETDEYTCENPEEEDTLQVITENGSAAQISGNDLTTEAAQALDAENTTEDPHEPDY